MAEHDGREHWIASERRARCPSPMNVPHRTLHQAACASAKPKERWGNVDALTLPHATPQIGRKP
jgi:hypothetical protein